MDYRKNRISTAVGVVIACGVSAANALPVAVTSWTLTDFDGDGLQSDFNFVNAPSGNSANIFGSAGEICGSVSCAAIDFDVGAIGVNVFTTGFNLGGGGDFQPFIQSGGASAGIDSALAAAGDGQALQFSAFDFGAVFQSTETFALAPDALINCTGAIPGLMGEDCGQGALNDDATLNNPAGYNIDITDLGGGRYGVVMKYIATFNDPFANIYQLEANLRLEGIMLTSHRDLPVPASVWLFGSGLLGLVSLIHRRCLS